MALSATQQRRFSLKCEDSTEQPEVYRTVLRSANRRTWCVKHPKYQAKRKPTAKCLGCDMLWAARCGDNPFFVAGKA
jgi:hypothetical protein